MTEKELTYGELKTQLQHLNTSYDKIVTRNIELVSEVEMYKHAYEDLSESFKAISPENIIKNRQRIHASNVRNQAERAARKAAKK